MLTRRIPDERLDRLENGNEDVAIFKNADCVLVGDLREMIAEIREYRKLKQNNEFWLKMLVDA